jgi:hypothetical protein
MIVCKSKEGDEESAALAFADRPFGGGMVDP